MVYRARHVLSCKVMRMRLKSYRLSGLVLGTVAILTISYNAYSQDAVHYNMEGVTRYTSGNYSGAIKMFENAYSFAPDNETIRSNLANAHVALGSRFADTNNLTGAIKELNAALEFRPDDADLYIYTACLYMKTNELPSAESMLLSALEIAPENKNAHMLLGDVYYMTDAVEDAVAQWRQVQALDPEYKNLRERLDKAERELGVEKDFVTDRKRRHFTISRGRDNFEEESRTILDILERAYYDIGKDLRCYPKELVQVILYSTEQFSEATRADAHVAALYDGKIRVSLTPENLEPRKLERLLRHEYTHVLVRELAGGHVPFWFNEGLAQSESDQYDDYDREMVIDAAQRGALIPLRELDKTNLDFRGDRERARLAYAEAAATVSYLKDRFSRRHLFDFMRLLDQYDTETALKTVYRRSYNQLHREVFNQ